MNSKCSKSEMFISNFQLEKCNLLSFVVTFYIIYEFNIFQRWQSSEKMESLKLLFEASIWNWNNVFTVTFDQLNASLQNRSSYLFLWNKSINQSINQSFN